MSDTPRWRRWLPGLIGILSLGVVLAIVVQQRQMLATTLASLTWQTVIPMLLLALALQAVNGLILALFARLFGVRLQPAEWFSIAVATSFVNYIAPFSAGLVVRAGYLKSRYDFPYSQFVALTTAAYLVAIFVAALAGVAITALTWQMLGGGAGLLLFFFAAAAVVMFVMMVLPINPAWGERVPVIGAALKRALTGWQMIRHDVPTLLIQSLLAIVFYILNGLLFSLAFRVNGASLPVFPAIALGIFLSLSTLIRVTPGNLGLQELLLGGIASLTGYSLQAGLSAAVVIRVVQVSVVMIVGPLANWFLTNRMQQADATPDPPSAG